MNKTKVFGYVIGVACIGWALYLLVTGRIVLCIAFFGMGCLLVETAEGV